MPVTAFMSPSGGEFLLIMLVFILLFGAKDAPRMFRRAHEFLDKIQRSAASFRYKLMYGDMHQNPADTKPYDADGGSPEKNDHAAEAPAKIEDQNLPS